MYFKQSYRFIKGSDEINSFPMNGSFDINVNEDMLKQYINQHDVDYSGQLVFFKKSIWRRNIQDSR